jgi:hypothetical protein
MPLDILPLVQFGLAGKHSLPRADFGFEVRYLDAGVNEPVARRAGDTNLTYVGIGPNGSLTGTHPDIRLLIPAVARDLGRDLRSGGLPLPGIGDLVLIEFPTRTTPLVRFSFLDPANTVHAAARRVAGATSNIGHGNAWWLPPGLSPVW